MVINLSEGFDWATVPKNGLVVDVGGGTGHVSLEIAKAFPGLNFVIEDRPIVINSTKQVCHQVLASFADNSGSLVLVLG